MGRAWQVASATARIVDVRPLLPPPIGTAAPTLTDSHCQVSRRHTSSDQIPLFRSEPTAGLTRTQNSPNSPLVGKLKFSCFTFLFVD